MYYSNKRLKPTTAGVTVRRKKHINCIFIGTMFFFFAIFVRALSRISTSARKGWGFLCTLKVSVILRYFAVEEILTQNMEERALATSPLSTIDSS